MENEIMNNEVFTEVAEEIVTAAGPNKILKAIKAAGAVGVVTFVGVATYKFIVKPIIKKVKDKELADGVTINDVEPVEAEIVNPDEN